MPKMKTNSSAKKDFPLPVQAKLKGNMHSRVIF